MPQSYRLVTPPAVAPVLLAEAKQHLRVDFADDDTLIGTYLVVAREYVEQFLDRPIFAQTYELALDSFPYGDYRTTVPLDQRNPWNYSAYWSDLAIRLPRPRCMSVTSITYLDGTGTEQTLAPASYYADLSSEPARIVPAAGTTWPITQYYLPGSIRVTYVAGCYGDGVTVNTCPQRIVLAVLMLTAHWYRNREAATEGAITNVPLSIESLLRPLRFENFGNFGSGY